MWEHTGSNRGPSACKADALNQLSYAPSLFWDGKDKGKMFSAKFFQLFLRLILLKFKKINLLLPINMSIYANTKFQEDSDTLTVTDSYCSLIVWNDEVNTFEWVIETLIEICGHSSEQAEQCAVIIDAKGKYAVKQGSYEILKPQCDAITERGINATIEVVAN